METGVAVCPFTLPPSSSSRLPITHRFWVSGEETQEENLNSHLLAAGIAGPDAPCVADVQMLTERLCESLKPSPGPPRPGILCPCGSCSGQTLSDPSRWRLLGG